MNINAKIENIESLKILRDDGKNLEFYIDRIRGKIPLNRSFPVWNKYRYLAEVDPFGIMSTNISINTSKKNHFETIDDFIYYVRMSDKETPEQIDKYPSKKESVLTREEFIYYYKMYFQEIFLNDTTDLINIAFETYIAGFFFFNEPSIIFLGCELSDSYWAFIYEPYM